MRVLYFDCFAGASGDMILGALLDIGVPLQIVQRAWEAVGLKVQLEVKEVVRGGIRGKGIEARFDTPRLAPEEMRRRIEESGLSPRSREVALSALSFLEEAERKVHGKGHGFHELGDPDTLLDLIGVASAIDYLNPQKILCSPLPLARGKVMTEHGPLPVPCPATLEILKGVPISPSPLRIENLTPTGAALLKALSDHFGDFPQMKVEAIGYGAGRMDPPELPNLLRAILGFWAEDGQRLWVLEADLDDLNPEILPYLEGRIREAGALDVVILSNRMKKGRVGVTVRCLTEDSRKEEVLSAFFTESTTLGVRGWQVQRWTLDREIVEVSTPYGPVKVKVGFKDRRIVNIAPEYESCASLARQKGVPLKDVYREALLISRRLLGDRR